LETKRLIHGGPHLPPPLLTDAKNVRFGGPGDHFFIIRGPFIVRGGG
jgi:hypothetical protein